MRRAAKSHLIRTALVVGVAMILVLGPGCSNERPERPEGRNLLLITLDTTRADFLGPYGGQEIPTPVLDALAAEGVVFTRAATPVPTTLSSHVTMLSGLMPHDHGVPRNGFALHDSVPLLAEMLRERGYKTVATISSFALDERFGLDRGFERYDCQYDVTQEGWSPWRHGSKTVNLAAEILSSLEEPFFLWVHLFDPHYPYVPAPEFDPVPADHPAAAIYQGKPTVFAMRRDRTHPQWDELIHLLRGLYAGEIAATDAQVGRVLTALAEKGLDERTLVVVLGDHGEGIGDFHEVCNHGRDLHQCTIQVPFIVRCPWREVAPRITAPVGTVDLLPTLAELLEFPCPDHVTGRSLVPLMDVDGQEQDATIQLQEWLQSRPFYLNATKPFRLEEGLPTEQINEKKAHGLMLGPWKYIHHPEDGTELLFHLENDPGERQNLLETEPDLVVRLREMVDRYWLSPPATLGGTGVSAEEIVDAETVRKLRSLGYLQ